MFRGMKTSLLPSYLPHKASQDSLLSTFLLHTNASIFSVFGSIVLGWYGSAVIAVLSSKVIMIHFPFPFFLCFSQFLFASLITTLLNYLNHSKPLSSQFTFYLYHIGVSYTFGFIFTNISFSLVNTSFAETIKSSEPVSSVILGYYLLNEVASTWTYLTLLPICLGVALACLADYNFHLYGFLFALLSNFCFSYRAVIAKQLYHLALTLSASSQTSKATTQDSSLDEIQLFHSISLIGVVIVTPFTVFLEAHSILERVSADSFTMQTRLFVAMCCLINGVGYTMYNVLSFYALRRSDVITHAVLNVFRRVVIITSSIFFFHVRVTPLNLCGIVLAIFGVVAFTSSRIKRK
jgi:drug/metabolite transporter (DMT)-like permease